MKWLKFIFIVALAIIFVGTSFVAIFGASRALGQILKVYVFKYEVCEYGQVSTVIREPSSGSGERQAPETEKKCYVDYNQAKRDVSDGLAMLIIAFPIAYISQRALRRFIKEAK